MTTPRRDLLMPAEWERHAATWIGWPVNPEDWPGKIAPVEWVFAEIVRKIAPGERVHILVPDTEAEAGAAEKLARAGVDFAAISFHRMPTDRNWLRDSGAIFARERGSGGLRALQFQFNAWAKYDNFKRDRAIPLAMARAAGAPMENAMIVGETGHAWMVLEGGAVDVNGAGLALATEECLLSPIQERNPGFGRREVEAALRDHLGAQRVIWLRGGIAGDDTHGHIDDAARFVGERKVLAAVERDPSSPNYRPLQENLEILRGWRDEKGALEVIELPMPEPLVFEETPLPASYANFYVANEAVLVPTFNDPNDGIALGILRDLFPERRAIGIHSVDLVWGFGTIHCLTQQQPA